MTERNELEQQAAQCRRLARSLSDKPVIDALSKLADELEARITDMDAGGGLDVGSRRPT